MLACNWQEYTELLKLIHIFPPLEYKLYREAFSVHQSILKRKFPSRR